MSPMTLRAILLALLLTAPLLALATVPAAPSTRTFSGAGTIVTSLDYGTGRIEAVDNGAVVCRDANGDGFHESGTGGVCIPFSQFTGNAVAVHDPTVPDSALAFQVCIDNNGDGICSGNGESGAYNPAVCADRITFSHSSGGGNANPLYVDHASARSFFNACARGGFPGYVVIVCAGAHNDRAGTAPHVHEARSGTVDVVTLPHNTGNGDYCGGLTAAKAYRVVTG